MYSTQKWRRIYYLELWIDNLFPSSSLSLQKECLSYRFMQTPPRGVFLMNIFTFIPHTTHTLLNPWEHHAVLERSLSFRTALSSALVVPVDVPAVNLRWGRFDWQAVWRGNWGEVDEPSPPSLFLPLGPLYSSVKLQLDYTHFKHTCYSSHLFNYS